MTSRRVQTLLIGAGVPLIIVLLHFPLRSLPYFWDEAGYYALAAADFYREHLLVPRSTWALGHTPLGPMYVASAWHLFGVRPSVARMAMALLAAATVIATYALGRRTFASGHSREMAAWSALLLALSPLFFAQSTMLHIDLPAALFVTLAVLGLLERRPVLFAAAASLAVLSKETTVIMLPVAWLYTWRYRQESNARYWVMLISPLLVLAAWTVYYHHETGFWTGNREYLKYNLYSTINPLRVLLSLARRVFQLLIGGCDWILVAAAIASAVQHRTRQAESVGDHEQSGDAQPRKMLFLGVALSSMYILFHSLVGGALLHRYLLPIYPLFYLCVVWYIWRLSPRLGRGVCAIAAMLFVLAWFVPGPYSFEFENCLAYSDFVRLHREAAAYLENYHGRQRVLTAWPASGEISRPFLGYVKQPLAVVAVPDFGEASFADTPGDAFDMLYLYSRKPESVHAILSRLPFVEKLNQRYFDYVPQISEQALVAKYDLKLLKKFEQHGQWVHIYWRPKPS
jgi:4-amino-4-deoxy-L-arabinose transferase-like glycosyltransferase